MKALIYKNPNEIELQDLEIPQPGPDEVLIKIHSTGICGSDMHAYYGHDPRRKPPLVLGHEFSGIIASGPDKGKRVTANPFIVCGKCTYCIQGRSNLCLDRGMIGMTRPGSFAEYMTTHHSSIIEIPSKLELGIAALTEPGATALHAVNQAVRYCFRPLMENRILVIGGGAIGLLCALLLRHYGVKELTIAETNPLRSRTIEQAIDAAILDPNDSNQNNKDPESRWDIVFDCVGAEATRKLSLEAVAPGGCVVHVGLQAWASE
ncbi:MAG: alcohol dehydrogenase catalytic domain-containing protein, partial [Spirochaetota bacterium]